MSDTVQLNPKLLEWVDNNLRRGCRPDTMVASLKKSGRSEADIRAHMGLAYPGVSDQTVPPERFADIALTRREAPGLKQVQTRKAQIYVWDDFLTPHECLRLCQLIETHNQPSTVADVLAEASVRTSSTCQLGTLNDRFVMDIDHRISEAIGINWPFGEPIQGQKYEVGQEFKAHQDTFAPGTQAYNVHCQYRGQRSWTFMIYLNDVEAGGATRFRRLEKTFRPQTGRAVIWNNRHRDGGINVDTLHHGMKVRSGTKYIITKWFRERGWGEMETGPDRRTRLA